jgi:anti-sigma B factor antagonist
MTLEAVPAHIHDWIEVSESGATLVVQIGGELDLQSRDSIEPAVMAAIASSSSVIVDLAQLTFCDSHGVAMFIAAIEKARAEGTALAIRHLLPPVRRVFEIANLDCRIELIA